MKRPDPTLCGNIKGDHFGKRMYDARTRTGMSRKDAAAAIILSSNQLGRIERGGVQMVSDPATLTRAAKVYGVNEVWLYSGGMAGPRLTPDWYRVTQADAA